MSRAAVEWLEERRLLSGYAHVGNQPTLDTGGAAQASPLFGQPPGADVPYVVTPAAASPNPDGGTIVNLTVLGGDAVEPESNLVYLWSVTGKAPADVLFDNNSTNSAKNMVAGLAAAGTYNFQVEIVNGAGYTAFSNVTLVVNQTFTSVVVTPASVVINENATQSFSAVGLDQFGNPMTTQPTFVWSATSGAATINSVTGLYTAAQLQGKVTVTAASGSISGTASVTITDAPPTVASPASATVGTTTAALSVLGSSDVGESNLTYTWSIASESLAGGGEPTFSINGTNAAKNTTVTFYSAGNYTFTALIDDGQGGTVTSSVNVTVNPIASSYSFVASSTTIAAGGTTQLTATSLDQFGNAISTQPVYSWSVSGVGTVSATGLYTAPASNGSAVVTAFVGGVAVGSAALTIAAPVVWYQTNGSSGATTLIDSSGNGQTAAISGNTFFVPGYNGVGKALDLDGGYASLPSGIVSTVTNFTITAWVNIPTLSAGAPIFSFGTGTTSYMYLAADSNATGGLTFGISTAGTASEQQINGPALSAGVWTHIAVTLEGSAATLYVNGTAVTRGTITLNPSNLGSTTQNYLGQSQFSADPLFTGDIQDFRIYGAALPAQQLNQIANISLPAGWTDSGIGGPGTPGTAFYDSVNSTWTIDGSGADIYGGSDQFNFASTTLTGDAVLTAEIDVVGDTDGYAKAGLMIRASDDPSSAEASVVMTPGFGVEFLTRSGTDYYTGFNAWSPINGPVWVQLDRDGSNVSAYFSNNDTTWYSLGTQSVSLGNEVLAGLASTSKSEDALSVSTLSNVSVAQSQAPSIVTAAAAAPATFVGRSTNLSVTAADDEGANFLTYTWAATGTPPAPVTFSASGTNAASLTQATFIASGTYDLTVTATDADGLSVQSTVVVNVSVPPLAPAGVGALWNGSAVSVTWQPSAGAVSYDIYRAAAIDGEGSTPLATGITATSFADGTAVSGTQYYYEVTAVGAGGLQSARSFEAASMTTAFTAPIISQFMAINNVTLTDAAGDYPDWLDLYNPTSSTVSIAGDYLTDSSSSLKMWQVPSGTLAPGAVLTVFADGGNDVDSAGAFHTNFSLSGSGGYLALVASNGTTVLSSYTFGQQITDIAYGIAMAQTGSITSYGGVGYLNPAPGAISGPVIGAAITAPPVFSYPSGFYSSALNLTINSGTAGASIYYTTDGTAPSATNGTLYTRPITVTGESDIRAVAIGPLGLHSALAAGTYIYLSQVLTQSANGQAPPGWPVDWGYSIVHYGMDPTVVDNSLYNSEITQDLLDLPSLSLTINLNDLFDPETGIYSQSNTSKDQDHPGTVELINPDGSPGFQADVGISLKGDYSALLPNSTHNFYIHFSSQYGISTLDYPVFGADAAQTFKELVLRTDENNSWTFSDPQYYLGLRDQFTNALLSSTGQAAEHFKICFLYIDGMFWGLYEIAENPNDDFAASYYGGSASGYDVLKATNVTSDLPGNFADEVESGSFTAWDELYTDISTLDLSQNANFEMIQGNNPNGTPNAAYPDLLDVNNLINYMLTMDYVGAFDSPYSLLADGPNNYFAIRPTDGATGFQFVATDSESTLIGSYQNSVNDAPTDPSGPTDATPAYFFEALQSNTEFDDLVADQIQRDFGPGGPMSVPVATAMFTSLVAEIQGPVVPESARWGDTLNPGGSYTRDNNWQPLVNSMLGNYFPTRTGIVLAQLEAVGLYPTVPPPNLSQYGGTISAGYRLSMSGEGPIYYTLDGSDPFTLTGTPSATSTLYTGPITLEMSTQVRAAILLGTTRSAEVDVTFYAPLATLGVTELSYDPATPAGGTYSSNEDQFIELKNFGTQTINLNGASFTNGITYTFGNAILAPGQVGVLVADAAAFAALYGTSINVIGSYQSGGTFFNDSGGEISLADPLGNAVFDFNYSSSWYPRTAGGGPTLEVVNPSTHPNLSLAASWRQSPENGGTPGVDDTIPTAAPSGLTSSFTGGQVVLSWTAVDGAASYNIYRGTTPGGESTTPIGTSTTNSFIDTTTSASITYYYTVTAVDPGGISPASNETSILTTGASAAPAITTQPVSELVTIGSNASFTAMATGYPLPTVQWDVSTNGGATWSPISGATSATYTFAVTSGADDGNEYHAVFTSSLGSVTSNAAVLTTIGTRITAWNFDTSDVTGTALSTKGTNTSPQPSTGNGTAVSIGMALFTGPDASNIYVDPGSSDGSSATNQVWRIVGTNGWNSGAALGTQGAQFMVSTVGYNSISLQFDLDVTAQGEGNLAVEYTINGGASWALAPSLNANGDTGISVKTNSTSANTVDGEYFSAYNSAGTEVFYNRLFVDLNNVTGVANNADFGIRLVNASTGSDDVNLSGKALNNTSGNWRFDEVDINGAPVAATAPVITSEPASTAVALGSTATFTIAATGSPTPTVQWDVSTNNGTSWTPISGATSTTLSIPVTSYTIDADEYEAVVSNSAGTVTSSSAMLTVVQGEFTGWNFDTSDVTGSAIPLGVNYNPDPSTGSGTASSLGMATFSGPNASNIYDDPGSSDGISAHQQAWRIVGSNGWNSNAPIGTQGAQFMVSTVGEFQVVLQFDLDVTAQGEGNVAVEYTLNGGSTWLLAPVLNANGDAGISVKTNSTSTNTVQGEYFSAYSSSGTEVWYNRLTADFAGVTGAANNPNFGIRLVNASTGADNVNLSGQPLNNTSGNWRIDEVDLNGGRSYSTSWTGAGDGINWNNPANWSDDAVPSRYANVTIGVGTTTIEVAAGTYAVDSLTTSMPIEIESGAALTEYGAGAFNDGLTLDAGSRLLFAPSNILVTVVGLNINTGATLDLANNFMVVKGGSLSTVNAEIASGYADGSWTGSGIISSSALNDPAHLTSLGVILNNNGSGEPLFGNGGTLGLFGGYSPSVSDVLIRYTYLGDANLDGKVDASDYSLIDNGFLHGLTGWYNGDFNYDNAIDGSDYAMIDNSFNTQGAQLSAEVASPQASAAAKSSPAAAISRNHRSTFVASLFQTRTPIAFAESDGESLELLLQKKDVLDGLSTTPQ